MIRFRSFAAPLPLWLAVLVLSPLAHAAEEKPAPRPPVGTVRLTTESFGRFSKADDAVSAATVRDRRLEMSTAASADSNAIADWKRRISADAAAGEALKGAGLGFEEYFGALVAVYQAAALVDLKSQGREAPASLTRVVPAENIAFVQKNPVQVSALIHRNAAGGAVRPNTIEDVYVAPGTDGDGTQAAQADPAAAKGTAGSKRPQPTGPVKP